MLRVARFESTRPWVLSGTPNVSGGTSPRVVEYETPAREFAVTLYDFDSDAEVTLEAGTGDEAQASESLDAEMTGDDISIAFNPAYLLDGLGALDSAYAELRFTASTRPAVLAGKDASDSTAGDDYRYLLMPVRLSG